MLPILEDTMLRTVPQAKTCAAQPRPGPADRLETPLSSTRVSSGQSSRFFPRKV